MMLEFFTNKELIEEIIKRQTFAGLILFSESEQRFDGQVHEDFKLYTTADEDSTLKMLENTVNALKTTN